MAERLLATGMLALALGLIASAWNTLRVRRLARERLSAGRLEPEPVEPAEAQRPPARPFQARHPLVPWVAGAILAAIIDLLAGLNLSYAVMFGGIAGIVAHEVEALLAARKGLQIEEQLADAIDLMVASLRAGAGVLHSLESATAESRAPLRPQLEEMLGRIRYGDDPQAVFRGLVARVPLETFRLFASALAVHGEVGGSLAPTLAIVGRIIRDRVTLSRRIRALTVQARFSTFAILGTTYCIGLLMWRADPPRMEEFLASSVGSAAVSGAVLLQGIGIVWTSSLSRLKY
jgi:tight adherence protein B